MTDRNVKKRRLTHEILGLLALSVLLTAAAFLLLAFGALHLVDVYFQEAAQYTENQVITAQTWILYVKKT